VKQVSTLFKNLAIELSSLYAKEEAASIARIIFKEILGISRTDIAIEPELQITQSDEEKIKRVGRKLMEGYPVQQILGFADFYGIKFKVNKYTLIPRPETEELVQWIIEENKEKKGLKILDIGTGSGCIAIALAKRLNHSQVEAIDISSKALNVAMMNSKELGVQINFARMDILKKSYSDKLGMFDIIVSNPPYVTEKEKETMHINVLEHDPQSALFVPDNDPLLFYNAIFELSLKHLTAGGKIYFEINEVYGQNIQELLESRGFKNVLIKKDLNGKDRMASGSITI